MIKISNDTIQTLLRNLPIVLDHVDYSTGGTKLRNAVRLTRKTINKLKQYLNQPNNEKQRRDNENIENR